ncbi:gp58-like family protein [Bacteroides sp. ET336]|uniref:gp58-like family protein n=1 Tax=Bacteroides sp. ET336 TaxID=2972459 RepID=UPI0021AD451F|nr:gp58-like family protein [Bacteroides sp. ET336]MCR8892453.1 gp58-like family protein [Bacteroides sp. ET336]MDN0056949.1 gp58-like family protein [Bacteroides caecigallinarum]
MAITGEDVDIIVAQVLERIKDDSVRIDDLARTNELAGKDLLELNGGRCVSLEDLKKFIKGIGIYLEVIGKNDKETIPTDNNVFSALRTLHEISNNEELLKKIFIRKDQKDITNFLLELLGGIITTDIKSDNLILGALGTGYGLLKTDSTGKSYFEIDKLFVRLKAVFAALEIMELTYSGGNYIFGPAGARCTKVEEFETYFRCYFTADDGSKKVKNKFRVDDFVQCREFNIEEGVHENVSNKYYWRRCVGIGEDYIDLSKTDRDMISDDVPAEGDNMVTIGNMTDASRQNVIIISVYGEGSPSFIQYSGINTYSLEGKAKTIISPSRNEFRGTFLFESGDDVKGYVDGEFASVRSDVAQLKIKDQEIVLSVSSVQSTAEAAKGTATNALNTANAAQNTANAAQESIAQIKVQVDNISLTVSSVEKKADDAQSAADSANSAISTVKTDVASLQLQVGNISLTVSSVEEKADAAQSTASSAASTASSAYNTAQSANSTASSAASTASSALSTASSALDKAENAQDDASSAISQVSSLKVQVGSITSTVSRLENGNELVSIINQTSTTIKLSALKIDLNGAVTANGTFSISTAGYITCTGGTIGGFSISSNSITCDGGGSTLSIGVSGGKFFRVNSTQDDGFMRLRADNDICLDITSYGESNSAIGLKVRCNAAGYGYAINSIGNVQLTARDGEYIKISGLTVNCKYVSSYPYQVQTCDDYLRVAGSSVILNFPHPWNAAGKIYFIRSAATSGSAPTIKFTCTLNRLFRASNGDIVDYIQYYDYKPRILMSDGVFWHEFISA